MRIRIHQDSLALIRSFDRICWWIASIIRGIVIRFYFLMLGLLIFQIILNILISRISKAIRMVQLLRVLLPVHPWISRWRLRAFLLLNYTNFRINGWCWTRLLKLLYSFSRQRLNLFLLGCLRPLLGWFRLLNWFYKFDSLLCLLNKFSLSFFSKFLDLLAAHLWFLEHS